MADEQKQTDPQKDQAQKPNSAASAYLPDRQAEREREAERVSQSVPAIGERAKAEPIKEVSATDLLSLWGGASTSPRAPAKSVTKQAVSAPQPAAPSTPPKSAPIPLLKPVQQVAPRPVTAPSSAAQPKPVTPPLPPAKAKPITPIAPATQSKPSAAVPLQQVTPKPIEYKPAQPVDWFNVPPPPPTSSPPAQPPAPPPTPPERPQSLPSIQKPTPATTLPLPEVFEAEIVTPKQKPPADTVEEKQPAELLEENGGFKAQLDEFLQELHLSRQHVFYGIGCLVLIFILIFGGIYGVRWYKNRTEPKQPEQESEQPKTQEPTQPKTASSPKETGIKPVTDVGNVTILDAKTLGSTGIAASVEIGLQAEGRTPIAYYIMTFRRLQNAYGTDLNELLNKSTDRRARLRGHLALLRKLLKDSTAIEARINRELIVIQSEFEPQKQKQEAADTNFFEQLTALNAQTAENVLSDFIDSSREVVELRARHKALSKIQSLYENALPKLANRIRDIELNEEALVAGIKVYDVSGSSLQLVVPVEGQPTSTRERFDITGPAIQFIPVHPSQVDVGKDFITKPGGGF